jgi:hypothetical protein
MSNFEATLQTLTEAEISNLVQVETEVIKASYRTTGKLKAEAERMLQCMSEDLLQTHRPATVKETFEGNLSVAVIHGGDQHKAFMGTPREYSKLIVFPVTILPVDHSLIEARIETDGFDSIINATPTGERYTEDLLIIFGSHRTISMADDGAQISTINRQICEAQGIKIIPGASITTAAFDGVEREYELAEYIVAIPCSRMEHRD